MAKSNYTKDDPTFGTIDLDDEFITDEWLIDRFVGSTLFGWGTNTYGQLGNGTTVDYSSPIQIGSLTNWRSISGGINYTAATENDGSLWAWGSNNYGRLGNNTTISYSSPIQIGALNNWNIIASASSTQYAIKNDGTLWAWGRNDTGWLGNGNTIHYSSPIQIGALNNWKTIAAGSWPLAIKTDGTLWAWGFNQFGELGNGTTISYSSPIQIGALTDWKQVDSGTDNSSYAIKTDGTLWAWGRNTYGQLGNTTTLNYSSPIQIGTSTDWKLVSASYQCVYAIKNDGTLWAWGRNDSGQLGIGVTANVISSPTQVGALNNWKTVVGNVYAAYAIKTDGTLWAWGYNAAGIGNGAVASYSSPIQIGAGTYWKSVVAGRSNSYTAVLGLAYTDVNA